MDTKIQKEFTDTGFGFPVRLMNVPMMKVRGEWTPKIDYNELARLLAHALSHKPARLTGNEIRFVRNHFEMTLKEFAGRFCVTHVAVIKWEKSGNEATAMNWPTEKDIRLFILSKLGGASKEIAELYGELEALPSRRQAPIHLDAKKVAA